MEAAGRIDNGWLLGLEEVSCSGWERLMVVKVGSRVPSVLDRGNVTGHRHLFITLTKTIGIWNPVVYIWGLCGVWGFKSGHNWPYTGT